MPAKTKQNAANGLRFERHFTLPDVSPFDQFEYDYRTSLIRNPSGEEVFRMDQVEVPRHWSQIATDIIAQKYFRKAGVPQPDGTFLVKISAVNANGEGNPVTLTITISPSLTLAGG